MALNLSKAVVGYLQAQSEEKFTARQIAEWVFATYPQSAKKNALIAGATTSSRMPIWCNSLSQKLVRIDHACK